jgi:hypothetical protein
MPQGRIFYYVHTGHRIGLDRFRRAATIIRALGDVDITLLCSDFRIAQIANDFGVEKSVGLDVVRNIPQIAHHGDKLIFDSEEANPIMLDDMRSFFSTFIRVSDSVEDKKEDNELLLSPYLEGDGICNAYAIDDKFFQEYDKTVKLSYFFGDDDYEKDLEKNLDFLTELNPHLQLGFYYFLDYEDMLKDKFPNNFEFEEYDEMITQSEILITSSPQAVLESLASGGKPIYVQREDYSRNFNDLFNSLNIPIVENLDINQVSEIIKTIDNRKYDIPLQNSNKISKFIKENLTL